MKYRIPLFSFFGWDFLSFFTQAQPLFSRIVEMLYVPALTWHVLRLLIDAGYFLEILTGDLFQEDLIVQRPR